MLSRVANSIYWMARYAERAENLARFIEVTLSFTLDNPDDRIEHWEPLVRATGDETLFAKKHNAYSKESVCRFLTFDRDYHGSIQSAITFARENARTIREAIASEAWEELNVLYHYVKDASKQPDFQPESEFYDDIVQHCYMLTGILSSTMTRGEGWHFLKLGNLLERADKTSRILDVKYFTLLRNVSDVDTTYDDLLWSAVLRSTCGLEMFRKRHHAITVKRIVDFLVFDSQFPRSILFCLQTAFESLSRIEEPNDKANVALLAGGELLQKFVTNDAESIIDGGLHEFTDSLQQSLNEIGDAIHETYFAQRPISRQTQSQQ